MLSLQRLFLNTDETMYPQLPLSELPLIKTPPVQEPRPMYRNPTAYTISVLTLLTDLGADIDINLRAFFEAMCNHTLDKRTTLRSLEQGDYTHLPGILDIQVHGLSVGYSSFGEKKNKSSRESTFSNQCTMRMIFEDPSKDEGYNIINVKLFGNGRMHFTGITSIEEAQDCTWIILERLERLQKLSKIHEQIVDFCDGKPSDIIKRIAVTQQISNNKFGDINSIFQKEDVCQHIIQYLPQKDVYRLALTCKFFNGLLSHNNTVFWSKMAYNRFKVLFVQHPLVSKYYIDADQFNVYVPKTTVKFEYFKLWHDVCVCTSSRYKPCFIRFDSKKLQLSNESIEMINSNFSTRFYIDQRKFTKLIQREFPYMNSSYEPDDRYHGIKIYWPHPDTVKDNGDETDTVYIFISVFRTGSVIMSGAKTEQQLTDAYNFINELIKKYYDRIWIPDDE